MRQETIDRIRKFTDDRDWDQFHSAANLAKSIVIEAAELLECFQWNDEEYDLQHVKEELADVIVPNPVLLAPYRTFQEIEQPFSNFVFRMADKQTPAFSLI